MRKLVQAALVGLGLVTLAGCGSTAATPTSTSQSAAKPVVLTTKANNGQPVFKGSKKTTKLAAMTIDSQAKVNKVFNRAFFIIGADNDEELAAAMAIKDFGSAESLELDVFHANGIEYHASGETTDILNKTTIKYVHYPNDSAAMSRKWRWDSVHKAVALVQTEPSMDDAVAFEYHATILPDGTVSLQGTGQWNGYPKQHGLPTTADDEYRMDISDEYPDRYIPIKSGAYKYVAE